MKRLPVESSNIKSIGHNFLTKNLEIEFKDGNIYRYKKVPRSIFRDIMGSESKGKYFFKNIRFDFPYRKYRNKDGEKVKSEWNRLHRKEDVDMSEKAASTILDELYKEAIDLNPVGSMLGSGAAMKGIGKAFSQGKMGRTGWQATKAGLMNVSNQSGKIVAKAGLAAAGGHMLGNAVDNMTKPTEEDQYGRRVAASEKLDEMYKEAISLGSIGSMISSGAKALSQSKVGAGIGKVLSQGGPKAGALVGAGIGGAAGAIKGVVNPDRDKNGETHRFKSAIKSGILGAGLGGATGAVGGAFGAPAASGVAAPPATGKVAASEKLDEMYKEAFVLGSTGTGALIGAGLGGVAGAIKGGMNDEKDENGKTHKVKSAIKSGLLGAGIGAAGGAAVGGAHGILKDSKALAQEQAKAVTNPKKEFTLSKQKMTARTEKPNALKRFGQRVHDFFHKPEGLKAKDKFDPVAEQNKKTISGILSGMPKKSCERLMDMVKEASLSPVAQQAIIGGAVGAVGGAATGAGNVMLNEKEKKGKLKKALSAAVKGGAIGGASGAATGATREAVTGALKKKKASEELNEMYKEAKNINDKIYDHLPAISAASLGAAMAGGTMLQSKLGKKKAAEKAEKLKVLLENAKTPEEKETYERHAALYTRRANMSKKDYLRDGAESAVVGALLGYIGGRKLAARYGH